MNENECSLAANDALDEGEVIKRVYSVCNVGQVPSCQPSTHLFAGKTASGATPVLVAVNRGKNKLVVNCEKMVIGSKLMKEIKQSLSP